MSSCPTFEALENLPAACERGFFALLNGTKQGRVLEAFADGVAQNVPVIASFLETSPLPAGGTMVVVWDCET